MSTATLTFDLPAEEDEHRAAIEGLRARFVLSELDEALRRRVKYGHDARIGTPEEAYAEMRDLLRGVLDENDLTLHW